MAKWEKPEIQKVELSAERPNLFDEFWLDKAYEEGFREVFEFVMALPECTGVMVFEPGGVA